MGEFLQQMLGFILIVFMLVFCDSFPYMKDRNLRRGNKDGEIISDKEGDGTLMEIMDNNDKGIRIRTTNSMMDITDSNDTNTLLRNTTKLLRNIRIFTERAIASILQMHLTNKRSEHIQSNIISSDVIFDDENSVYNENENKTTNIEPLVLSTTNNKDNDKNSSVIHKVLTSSWPAPAKSQADRWLSGLRTYRRRRSFFSDFGIGLESAFEDDTSDVIFGAHTSACDYADRHYCLNGGTCIFVGVLEIKTCRCKIGYTGLRCESINQEFLLALLAEEFF